MVGARVINEKGCRIVFISFARGTNADVAKVIEEATPLIRTRPEKSVLTLTDATEIGISKMANQQITQFLDGNKPYVKAAAVYGVSGLATAILATIRLITGRDLATFGSREEALEWLVSRA